VIFRAGPEFMQGTKDQIKATTNTCLAVLVFGTGLFYTFVNPKLNRLEDRADSLSREVFKLKQEIVKMKNIKDEGHKAKIYQDQSMETSGIYFIFHLPFPPLAVHASRFKLSDI
jgi:hypothetical protein